MNDNEPRSIRLAKGRKRINYTEFDGDNVSEQNGYHNADFYGIYGSLPYTWDNRSPGQPYTVFAKQSYLTRKGYSKVTAIDIHNLTCTITKLKNNFMNV